MESDSDSPCAAGVCLRRRRPEIILRKEKTTTTETRVSGGGCDCATVKFVLVKGAQVAAVSPKLSRRESWKVLSLSSRSLHV